MPKNKGLGGKSFRKGKKDVNPEEHKKLIVKEEFQEYAKVTKILGNGRVFAKCNDGKERLCIIPGKFRGKRKHAHRVVADGFILIDLRDYQDGKADITHIYTPFDVKRLIRRDLLDLKVFGLENEDDIKFEDNFSENIHEEEEDEDKNSTKHKKNILPKKGGEIDLDDL